MNAPGELDLGTPEVGAGDTVTLEIDGIAISVTAGTSLLRAAAEAGVMIPKLCATDILKPFGSCRLCLVEIEGRKGYPSSCTTPAEAGMKVRTQSPQLAKLRRNVMELYISDHPLDCLTCSANGNCELQTMAGVVGLREVRYGAGENHFTDVVRDESNPYFSYDPGKCIVCNLCVRACEEQQGTFALTIAGRGFGSRVMAGQGESFLESDCVSCGACVQACPTATLMEKTVVEKGQAERSVTTTCAYCGVGCGLRAEMKGAEVVRMVPWKDGRANEGHACVKGRFAWGYATHPDRITKPMIRTKISDPWREVTWDEALAHTAREFRRIQQQHGRNAIGAIVSSRCTNEEDYLVQKLVRTAFGNNNVDTCARVCHSPTGYGLKQTLGESAGTQTFKSVAQADVIVVLGANPSDAHPVFASRLKRRVREGAKLVVIDPREIDLVSSPHIRAEHHLKLRPGTNVAVLSAMAHVIVTEGLVDEAFVAERCEAKAFNDWREFVARPANSPEALEAASGVPAATVRAAARLYATGGNAAIYYGLGVTEHSQGSTAVIAIANLAMATGNVGREGVGVNPLRGQNNVQGSCDMGSFPHELPGYRHVSDTVTREMFERDWGVEIQSEPGLRIPNMFEAAQDGSFLGLYCQGEDPAQSDPNTQHVTAALAGDGVRGGAGPVPQRNGQVCARLPARRLLPRKGRHLHQRRAPHFARAPRHAAAGRDGRLGSDVCAAKALGYEMHYEQPVRDHGRDRTPDADLRRRQLRQARARRQPAMALQRRGAGRHADHARRRLRAWQGPLPDHPVRADRREGHAPLPAALTTGRVLSQYNVGAQTRRTANTDFYGADLLEIHPHDAGERGIREGDRVGVESRAGKTVLPATLTERVQPGVVYTTFHFPESGANVITTDNSDWATNCPEYKVTAVQVARLGGA
jgi:formate dehydrogenase major subunit